MQWWTIVLKRRCYPARVRNAHGTDGGVMSHSGGARCAHAPDDFLCVCDRVIMWDREVEPEITAGVVSDLGCCQRILPVITDCGAGTAERLLVLNLS